MKSGNIPAPAVRRLSLYLRQLEALWRSDHRTVSSKQLGTALKLTDAQVRKDLAYFGQFGHPGIGYNVEELIARIRRILGTDRTWNVLLVGAGHLGMALSAHRGFNRKGFRIVAVFDTDRAKIGQAVPSLEGVRIQPIAEIGTAVRDKDIRLAIIAVPAEAAQDIADRLLAAGIRGLLNFAPVSLDVRSAVAVSSVDLAVQLEQLSFQVGTIAALEDITEQHPPRRPRTASRTSTKRVS
jgi:redox-sensing transcriptional repressor